MAGVKTVLKVAVVLIIMAGALWFLFAKWSWIFSKHVSGVIVSVERVTEPEAMIGSRLTKAQIHSYAVLIRTPDGKLYASSSEDRQWQVAKAGYCVEALLFTYPPWEFGKSGTYFNARLKELKICDGEPPAPGSAVPVEPEPQPDAEIPQGEQEGHQ